MKDWSCVADGYRRSFALACAPAAPALLHATAEGGTPGDHRARHLDVGCGDGRLAAAAVVGGRSVTACDPDLEMCALTRERSADMTVSVAALPDLPYASVSFDVVTASFVLNHVRDPRRCAAEIARVCRPGGVVAATIWPAGGGGFGSSSARSSCSRTSRP